MVVFFPPSTYTRRRDYDDDDDEPGARYYYVDLEVVSSDEEDDDDDDQQPRTTRDSRRRRARLILEVPDDEEEEEEEETDEWDPCLHLDELPMRPMSRFHKVLFVVATAALEGVFVRAALQQVGGGADKVINWLIAVPLMLLAMICILCLAAFVYVLVATDFSWRPPPAPADEKV